MFFKELFDRTLLDMKIEKQNLILRPNISDYQKMHKYVSNMIQYLKFNEKGFSIYRACAPLRRVSPSLISLISKGQRKITLDRIDELSKLLRLLPAEKSLLRAKIENSEGIKPMPLPLTQNHHLKRKEVSTSILNDWINVYVKDLFQIKEIQSNPELLFEMLSHVASKKRIEKSIRFLLTEGHLKRNQVGHIVIDTQLSVADPGVTSEKIRQFHKGALGLAKVAIDLYPTEERRANTLVIPLDKEKYEELNQIIDEFSERIKAFAESNENQGNRLYQMVLNLSPIGGEVK